jgi:hypothetical protein
MTKRSFGQILRQNHAVEHATVTILSRRAPGVPMMARSDLSGFTLFGEVETGVVEEAVNEALARLQAGEANLAVHPNCGTNLVTSAVLSGAAAVLAAGGKNRSWADRLPSAVLATTLALIIAMPAGRWVQQNVTTSPQVDGLQVTGVTKLGGPVSRFRVTIGS